MISQISQITSTAVKPQNASQVEQVDMTAPAPNRQPAPNTSFSPESSLRIVNDKVIESIDKELAKTNATPIRELDAQNFTPESVAKGILGFVQNALSRAKARGQSTQGLFEQAKIGIETGFKQAKDILTGLNALSGQIAEGVQKTYNLIHDGLQALDTAQKNGTIVDFNNTITTVSQQTQSYSQSFELNIQTRDGDNVQVLVAQDESRQQYNASMTKGDANAEISQTEIRSSNNIRLTVSGNLDEAEVTAIQNLLTDVKTVSDSFFKGDASATFEAGLSLGFNTKEIASFALSSNQNQTQTASRAYREVSGFNENNTVSPAQLENLLKPAREFMNTLTSSIEKANSATPLDKASSKPVESLLGYFSRANPNNTQQIQNLESLAGTSFENITQQLTAVAAR